MNRLEFDNLDIVQQIDFINEELSKGNNLTKLCKHIGIGRTTVRDRADKVGAKFNKELNLYEYVFTEEPLDVLQNQDNSNNDNTNIKVINTKTNKLRGVKTIKNNELNNCKAIAKVIMEINGKLDEVYSWYSKEKNIIEQEELKINKFEGNPINRTFKLYPDIQNQFKKFCEEHNTYKVQDIISQALYEFMIKYK